MVLAPSVGAVAGGAAAAHPVLDPPHLHAAMRDLALPSSESKPARADRSGGWLESGEIERGAKSGSEHDGGRRKVGCRWVRWGRRWEVSRRRARGVEGRARGAACGGDWRRRRGRRDVCEWIREGCGGDKGKGK
jgi:hypothetical protein